MGRPEAGTSSSPESSATGTVKVKRAPRPAPSLSARMRPPCASTSPLQITSPRPVPATGRLPAPSAAPAYLRNSWGSSSGAMPLPSSETETATWTPSRSTETRIGADSGECRAALASRLFSTCAMRRRSAITGGRSPGRSMRTLCRAPPDRNVLRARSTSAATSEGSGATESMPASMRPASSRSPIRPRMYPACSWMMR